MKKILTHIFIVLIILNSAWAQSDTMQQSNTTLKSIESLGSKGNPIKVGVMLVAPFAAKSDGYYKGIVIDYWKSILHNKDKKYIFLPTSPNYDQAVLDLHNGKYDVLLGNFSTTYERSFLVDFSEPYFLTEVSILTSSKKLSSLQKFSNSLYKMSNILLFVFVIFLLLSYVFWIVERKQRNFHISHSFFSTSVAMISGDTVEPPTSIFNKILFVFILIAGMHLQAIVIASMTNSAISDDQIDPFIKSKDMHAKKFVVVKGSDFVNIIKQRGAYAFEFSGNDDGAAQYYIEHMNDFDGFVTEKVLAQRYQSEHKKSKPDLYVSKLHLRNDVLAIIFNKNFPYQNEINENILYLQDNNLSYSICLNYIGEEESYQCVL